MRYCFVVLSLFLLSCGKSSNNYSNDFSSTSLSKAQRLLLEDLIKLSEGGLGDRVQLALVRRHKEAVFLTTEQMIELKRRGISDRVIKRLIIGYNE